MKRKIFNYHMYVCKKEMDYLRFKHPCLLNQAIGYGYEYTSSEHHFYNMPKVLHDNMKLAIRKMYQP